MLKKTIIAAAAVVAATTAFQPVEQAQAKVHFDVHLGTPGYYAPRPHYYAPRPHYYAPRPHYYAPRPQYYAPRPQYYAPRPHYKPRFSYCSRARANIRRLGYYRVSALDCSGKRYTFQAKRGGQWYRLRVKARSGRVYKVTYF